jgi:hypothetical protein
MKLTSFGRLLVALPVVVALLWVSGKAACVGWADFVSLEARYRVDQVGRDGIRLNIGTWLRMRDQLEAALEWDGNNPVYHEYLAALYVMRAADGKEGQSASKTFYQLALEKYLRAAYLRPTSGYTHASIATVKFRLGEFDGDFSSALVLASAYGPWEPAVQYQVMDAGLRTWGGLAENARSVVRGNIRRAIQMNPKRAREFLAARKNVLPQCAQLQVVIPDVCPST